MRTLSGRIGLVLLVFALATLLAIGGSLWVVLRELHRDATIGALTELTVPYAATARSALPQSLLRPGQASSRNLIERIEQRMEGEEFAEELEEFAESFSEDVSDADVAVIFTSGDSSIIFNPEEDGATRLNEVPELGGGYRRGQVATGTTEIDGIGEVLFATTPLFNQGPLGGQERDPDRNPGQALSLIHISEPTRLQ